MLRQVDNPAVRAFQHLAGTEPLVIGDIVLLEVLQGASSEARARVIEAWLRAFAVVPMLDDALAVRAAGHYRRLRGLGITPRATPDLIVATWCIANNVPLLHRDRDYAAMAEHCGLPVQPV
ncbi:MAG: PilT protein domain protein [Belnapia sp.]|nr:PilT protein domain protein [Belnapia sp.]